MAGIIESALASSKEAGAVVMDFIKSLTSSSSILAGSTKKKVDLEEIAFIHHMGMEIVNNYTLRYKVDDVDKACKAIETASLHSLVTYLKLKELLGNEADIEQIKSAISGKQLIDVVATTDLSGKSKEQLDELKREHNRVVSTIDKQLSQINQSK